METMNAKPFRNDERLMKPVRIRVLKSFCVAGQTVSPGDEIMLERALAGDLAALGKCELME